MEQEEKNEQLKNQKTTIKKSIERKNNVILFRCVQHPPPLSDHQIRKATNATNVNITNCNTIKKAIPGPAASTPFMQKNRKFKRMGMINIVLLASTNLQAILELLRHCY